MSARLAAVRSSAAGSRRTAVRWPARPPGVVGVIRFVTRLTPKPASPASTVRALPGMLPCCVVAVSVARAAVGEVHHARDLDGARGVRRLRHQALSLVVGGARAVARHVLDGLQRLAPAGGRDRRVEHLARLGVGDFSLALRAAGCAKAVAAAPSARRRRPCGQGTRSAASSALLGDCRRGRTLAWAVKSGDWLVTDYYHTGRGVENAAPAPCGTLRRGDTLCTRRPARALGPDRLRRHRGAAGGRGAARYPATARSPPWPAGGPPGRGLRARARRAARTADWRDLVRDDEVDAVYVATPVRVHAEQAIAAAEAGKHVLCEKPMALTAAECERMIAAARPQRRAARRRLLPAPLPRRRAAARAARLRRDRPARPVPGGRLRAVRRRARRGPRRGCSTRRKRAAGR